MIALARERSSFLSASWVARDLPGALQPVPRAPPARRACALFDRQPAIPLAAMETNKLSWTFARGEKNPSDAASKLPLVLREARPGPRFVRTRTGPSNPREHAAIHPQLLTEKAGRRDEKKDRGKKATAREEKNDEEKTCENEGQRSRG